MAAIDVLELLLTARYVGTPAFRALEDDLAGIGDATNGLQRLGAAMSTVGTLMIAGGVAMAAGVGYAVKAASDYDSAIQRIVAVTPLLQTHKDALAQLNNEIAAAATTWGISPTEIAQGSYMLMSSAGVLGPTGAQQLLNANIINELAMFSRASGYPQAGGVSYSDAANQLPRIFAAAGLNPSDWGGAMGYMTYLENQSHMNQSQMTNAMSAYLPAMVALHESFPDAATLIAAEASSGRVGSPSGRELLSALTLMFGGASQQAELHALGLNTGDFFSKNGQILPTDQIMALLQSAIYGHAKSPADVLSIEHALFGQVGLRALGPLLSPAGFTKYQNLLQGEKASGITNMQTAELYLRAVAEKQMQQPSAQFDALKASLELLAITIGNQVLPMVLQLVHALTDLALKATQFVVAHPELTKALAIAGPLGLIGGGVGMKGAGTLLGMLGNYNAGVARRAPGILEDMANWDSRLREHENTYRAMQEDLLNQRDARLITAPQLRQRLADLEDSQAYDLERLGPRPTAELTAGQRMLAPFQNLFNLGTQVPGALFDAATAGATRFIAIVRGIPGFLSAAGTAAADAARWLLVFAQNPLPFLQMLGGAIRTLVTGGFSALLDGIASFGEVLGNALVALPAFAAGVAAVAIPVLLVAGAIATIVLLFTVFRAQGEQIVSFLGSVFGPVFQLIAGAVGLAVATIENAWNSAYPAINDAMNSLVDGIKAALPLFQLIGIVLGAVVVVVIAAVTGLAAAFLSALGPIIRVFGDLFTFIGGILNLIVGLFTLDGDKIKMALGQIAGGFLGVFKDIGTALGNFIQSFLSTFLGFIGTVVNAITGGLLARVGSALNNFGQTIQNGFNQLFPPDGNSQFARSFVASANKMVAAQEKANGQMNNAMSAEAKVMYNYGVQLAQDLADGVYAEQQYENYNMQVYGHKIGEHIVNGAKTHLNIQSPSKVFFYLGQMVSLGMQQGILAGMSGVIQATTQVASAAVATARNTLKLHSPSQVFHDMGVMTMKGFQNGVSSHHMDWGGLVPQMPDHIGSLKVGSIHTGPIDNNGAYRFALAVQGHRESVVHRYDQDRDAISYAYRLGYEYTA